MAGTLGILQERTFAKYGPHWREGMFFTVSVDVEDACLHSFRRSSTA